MEELSKLTFPHCPTYPCFRLKLQEFCCFAGNYVVFSYTRYKHLFGKEAYTLRTGSFKLFKRPFPGFLTILTL